MMVDAKDVMIQQMKSRIEALKAIISILETKLAEKSWEAEYHREVELEQWRRDQW